MKSMGLNRPKARLFWSSASQLSFTDVVAVFFVPARFHEGSEAMGGGADHGGHHGEGDFRAKVWSMSGGPNCRPKHWKRNTAIAMFGVFLICIPIGMLSAKLEQRPHQPVRPIPSQLWCKNFGNKEYEKR